jgi:hypothetical protein
MYITRLLLLIQWSYFACSTLSCQNARLSWYISARTRKHEPHLALFSTLRVGSKIFQTWFKYEITWCVCAAANTVTPRASIRIHHQQFALWQWWISHRAKASVNNRALFLYIMFIIYALQESASFTRASMSESHVHISRRRASKNVQFLSRSKVGEMWAAACH